MSLPILTPSITTSAIVLPSTGSTQDVSASLPYGIFSDNENFLSGACEQVTYVYRKLGGDVLDIELTPPAVYSAYQEACLEYGFLINIHQAKNALGSALGGTTGSFDHRGELVEGSDLSASLSGTLINNKYPKFDIRYTRRVGQAISTEVGVGGTNPHYSASIDIEDGVQDYDLQRLIASSSVLNQDAAGNGSVPYASLVDGKRVTIHKVFYKTPRAMWRFFGNMGFNTIGNLGNYGMFSDSSDFQIIPVWYTYLQAQQFEDNMHVRASHFSYELVDNKIRLFPIPDGSWPDFMWVEFSIPQNTWEEDGDATTGINGINNLNTFPVSNLDYNSINAVGKQFIRRFALALCKETLGYIRSKFSTIPIPGESVTLNGPALVTEAREEQNMLREELKKNLDDLTYLQIAQNEATMVEAAGKVQQKLPTLIYVG